METYYKETASQTFGVGDLVYLDSNGTVAICTTTSHKLNSPILGIAEQAATGVTGSQVRVRVIHPNDVFVMNGFHTTVASSVSVQTQLQPNVPFGIYMDTAAPATGTGGKWTVDLINTSPETGGTLARLQVVGFVLSPDQEIVLASGLTATAGTTAGSYVGPAIGDAYPPLLVRFLPFSIQSDGSAHAYVLQGGF
jgi:hypothetical protein